MNDEDIANALIESEDEDVFEDIEDIPIHSDSSSDESDTSDSDETTVPSCSTAKKRKVDQRKWDQGEFTPVIHEFNSSNSGIQQNISVSENSLEIEFFEIFFTLDVVKIIVSQTNKYAAKISLDVSLNSKMKKWKDTTEAEMYTFFATIMLMGLVGKNSLKKYWTNNPVIETPFFKVLFSQDRFLLLLRALHFSDNDMTTDKLCKIRNLLDPLKTIFKTTFYPFQNLCIDESLVLWKGRLSFKIYIPSKRHRFGIKLFVHCDALTGYVLDIIVYTGSESDIKMNPDIGISGSVVTTMLSDYLGKGHRLFVDNWYTSPTLFDFLHKNKTNACGTVRANRKDMPKFGNEKMKRGEVKALNSNNLMAMKWRDKRDVIMLTNIHSDAMIVTDKIDFSTGENKIKPEAVLEYTKNMGAVDKVDRILGFADSSRKSLKWYKKIFFRLIDIGTLNAFFLHRLKTQKVLSFSEFRENLISQLVEKYHTNRPASSGGRRVVDHPTRLLGKHFLRPVPETGAQGKRTQRQCHVCRHTAVRPQKRKDTKYMCTDCNVAFCIYPCFEDYHTKKQY